MGIGDDDDRRVRGNNAGRATDIGGSDDGDGAGDLYHHSCHSRRNLGPHYSGDRRRADESACR